MNLENVKYDAFISYRHCELDKFVAENLHKQLESFKIPKNIIASGKLKGKTKIERVFRDRDELPLASNLADPITTALSKSDFLIVICSPRLPESKWCLKEIETFIEMHGREHILAVLIEGEPAESFPEILRYDEQTITNADGSTHIEKVEVEPLAADVRGKDKKEVLKQIKSELLRLIAPMLDCNYDDLKMRHKEARQKKILRISLAISMVCLIFTAISTTMALTIHKQSNTIEKQYHKALETKAVSYASISQTLLKQEDRMAAMKVARMALPDSLAEQKDKPYTAAAEYALSDCLGIYNNGKSKYPVKTLEQNSPVSFMLVSPDETTITTIDNNNMITIFDVNTAAILVSYTIREDYESILDKNSIAYLGNDQLVYIAEQGFCIYDIPSKTETFFETELSTSYIKCAWNGEYFAISGYDGFEIYDKSGKSIYSYIWPEYFRGDNAITFNTDQSLCAFTGICNTEENQNGLLNVVNFKTGEMVYSTEIDVHYFDTCVFYSNQLIVAGRISYHPIDNPLDYTSDIHIVSYPFNSDVPNWEYVKVDSAFSVLTGVLSWENQTIVLGGYDDITFINGLDGSLIHSTNIGANIIDIAPLKLEGNVLVSTEQGKKILVSSDSSIGNSTMEEYDISNGNFEDFYFASNFDAAYHRNAASINIYQTITSDQAELTATMDDHILNGIYSEKQKAFVTSAMSDLYFLRHIDSEASISISYDEYLLDFYFVGEQDEKFAFVNTNSITYYDTKTGEKLETVSLNDAFAKIDTTASEYVGTSKDGKTLGFFSSSDNCFYLYSTKDNSVTPLTLEKDAPFNADYIGTNETLSKYAVAYPKDNTLCIYDCSTNKKLAETTLDAALVSNIIISDAANSVIVSHLDKTVTVYNLSDLTVRKTYTNLASDMQLLVQLPVSAKDSNTPSYVLYGSSDGYLLNEDLELVAHLYKYMAYDEEKNLFYLLCKDTILSVPYYNYEMLIKEADKQLENYELSDYRKNQLGL